MMDWKWRVGVLRGLGECAWQEMGANMRRITRVVMDDMGRVVFLKSPLFKLSKDPEPQYAVADLLVSAIEPSEDVGSKLSSLWSGLHLAGPQNGRIQ